MRLIEPLGLLHGRPARDAIAAGFALPLAGGPAAFALARLHGPAGAVLPVQAIPPDWTAELGRLTAAPPPWAGLPVDRPLVMGILNVTTDSFSDGGLYAATAAAIDHGRRLAEEGADLVDVGGESTRPGSLETPVSLEQDRVLPVIRTLAGEGIVVSVDTRHAETMVAALDAGAAIVNDVSGFGFDARAAAVVRERGCPVVVQHMRGVPATMNQDARYEDVAMEVTLELAERLASTRLDPALVMVDPGIGFAKLRPHNLQVLARLPVLLNLGCRILVGASRKSFLGATAGEPEPAARVPGSLAAGLAAVLGGAAMLRVHDVAATVQALRIWTAIADAA